MKRIQDLFKSLATETWNIPKNVQKHKNHAFISHIFLIIILILRNILNQNEVILVFGICSTELFKD